MWIANAARCQEIDRQAKTSHGISSETLMQRAGEAVFHLMMGMLPARRRVAVVCGKGNNGGDGFVVAGLAKKRGLEVSCFVAACREDLSADASRECETAEAAGVVPVFFGEPGWLAGLAAVDVIVDALLGTGSVGAPSGAILEAILGIEATRVPVISVDVPSGIACDSGVAPGAYVHASRTVTFGLPKACFFQGDGLEACGEWSLAEIGFPRELLDEPTGIRLIDAAWVSERLPKRVRNSHKGENGRVLILAGSHRMRGAAVLSAHGALRSGAGLVTVAGLESVCAAVSASLPEATLLPLPESEGVISPLAAELLLSQECDAAVFGPGMTASEPVLALLRSVWSSWTAPSCLDADALNAVAAGVTLPESPCVLTPHPGEMGRLMGTDSVRVQGSRFAAAREAAAQFGKTVLLKGACTVVSEDGEDLLVNPTGNPGMAAPGMGDVLSGVVATLLAQGLRPYEAAGCAAFWHGLAGDLCGPTGYSASDVAARLPEARAKITSA